MITATENLLAILIAVVFFGIWAMTSLLSDILNELKKAKTEKANG